MSRAKPASAEVSPGRVRVGVSQPAAYPRRRPTATASASAAVPKRRPAAPGEGPSGDVAASGDVAVATTSSAALLLLRQVARLGAGGGDALGAEGRRALD